MTTEPFPRIDPPPDVMVRRCWACDEDAIVYRGRWSIHLGNNPKRPICLASGSHYFAPTDTGWIVANVGQGGAS